MVIPIYHKDYPLYDYIIKNRLYGLSKRHLATPLNLP